QGVGVALQPADLFRNARVGGPAQQGRQGIRAWIDDGHRVPGFGQRHGEATGAPAHIDHAQRAAVLGVQLGAQNGPDHRGSRPGRARVHHTFHVRETTRGPHSLDAVPLWMTSAPEYLALSWAISPSLRSMVSRTAQANGSIVVAKLSRSAPG